MSLARVMSMARLSRILLVAGMSAALAVVLIQLVPAERRPSTTAAAAPPTGLELLAVPPPQPAEPPAIALAVDSRGADETYPVWLWTPASSETDVGMIEESRVADGVLQLSGWAGDLSLGLRMADVLVVACDRVIATVPVSEPREDIAQRHPNLTPAGWSARVGLADLAPCPSPAVSVYGVARFGSVLFPMAGDIGTIADAGHAPPEGIRLDRRETPLRTPERTDAPVRVVTLNGDGLALRRCGQKQCAVIGRLPAGRQRLVILDSQSGWQLVASTGGEAGWAPTERLYGSN